MKKIIAVLLVAMMALSLVACGNTATPATETYKTGLGMVVNTSVKPGEDAEDPTLAQADATACVLTTDAAGKIVDIHIDAVQMKANYAADGVVTGADAVQTKRELGDNYNMKKYAGSVGEWYEEAAAFEAYCIGKTVEEVVGMELGVNEATGYEGVPVDADLKASCTIKVTDFIAAIEKAAANATEYTGYAASALGCYSKVTGGDEGASEGDATYCAVVTDKDGKIVAISFDVAQCKAAANDEGAVEFNANATTTKKELGDNYNMKKYSAVCVGEWYEQIAALENYCLGKTIAEVEGMELGVNANTGYEGVPADADLMTTCTIKVVDFLAALTNAASYM